MASFFTVGETKIRPGVYYRYENFAETPTAGADDGKCACVLRSNWGPLDSAVLLESYSDIYTYFGDGGSSGTLEVPIQQFLGGAKSVRAVRLGTGGEKSSLKLQDEEGVNCIELVAKYVGARELSVTLRPTLAATYFNTSYLTYEDISNMDYEDVEDMTYEELEEVTFDDDAVFELLILEGTTQLECIQFYNPKGEKNTWNLSTKGATSKYVDMRVISVTESCIATINQEPMVGGADPYVNVDAYSSGFEVLETYRWNVFALDTEDYMIGQMTQCFLNRIYADGKFGIAVLSDSTSVDFETRITRAETYNDYQIVYVGSGFQDSNGELFQGYVAAARISGMIAGTPSSESVTRSVLTGATDLVEYLTSSQYETAITSGMLTFSLSPSNTVWVEQGINTLTVLGDEMDAGWKKIKRAKVRFELFQRLNDAVEPLVGKVNNNDDGRMTVVQVGNGICKAMISEGKLLSGAKVEVDPEGTNSGDSATFVVYADDIDSMEKIYLGFKFRFSPES